MRSYLQTKQKTEGLSKVGKLSTQLGTLISEPITPRKDNACVLSYQNSEKFTHLVKVIYLGCRSWNECPRAFGLKHHKHCLLNSTRSQA